MQYNPNIWDILTRENKMDRQEHKSGRQHAGSRHNVSWARFFHLQSEKYHKKIKFKKKSRWKLKTNYPCTILFIKYS